MMENGPWRMDGKGGFKTTEGGWEEYTTMIYGLFRSLLCCFRVLIVMVVDQPAGTGFSYTSTNRYIHTLNEVICLSHEICSIS